VLRNECIDYVERGSEALLEPLQESVEDYRDVGETALRILVEWARAVEVVAVRLPVQGGGIVTREAPPRLDQGDILVQRVRAQYRVNLTLVPCGLIDARVEWKQNIANRTFDLSEEMSDQVSSGGETKLERLGLVRCDGLCSSVLRPCSGFHVQDATRVPIESRWPVAEKFQATVDPCSARVHEERIRGSEGCHCKILQTYDHVRGRRASRR